MSEMKLGANKLKGFGRVREQNGVWTTGFGGVMK